ncbi:hypothetical protein ACROYT_G031820 [Oculina patagonica]
MEAIKKNVACCLSAQTLPLSRRFSLCLACTVTMVILTIYSGMGSFKFQACESYLLTDAVMNFRDAFGSATRRKIATRIKSPVHTCVVGPFCADSF